MQKARVGLIGCGGRLRGVMRRVMDATDQITVASIYDPSEISIETTLALYPDAQVAESVDELVSDSAIDWVMIGSWNCFHRDQAIAALQAGKHVFCEKPLATNLDDCLAMREAWRSTDRHFIIGLTLRYSAHYERIKELLDSGEIGTLISMEFNETLDFNHGGFIHGDWRRFTENAGTHLLEKCCHDIDLVNWLVGSRARFVASFGGLNFFRPENAYLADEIGCNEDGRKAFQTWFGREHDPFTDDKTIIDNQVAIVEFENGVRTTFHTNCSTAIPERRMYFCGSEGTIRADVLTGEIEVKRIGFDTEVCRADSGVKGGHGGGDSILGEKVAACILGVGQPHTTLDDGFTSAITCFGIDEAMETRQVVDMRKWWTRAGL